MMDYAEAVTIKSLEKQKEKYLSEKSNTILRHALSNTVISQVVKSQDKISEVDFSISNVVKTMGATNQKRSGRCWIFAATNVLREIIAKKLNLAEFELSQSFIAFYDKLEKINFELEAIIDLLDAPHDDRTLNLVLNNTTGDGGQWDMFANVVKKYGVVPKNVYPETFQSSNTGVMSRLVDVELRKFAAKAKKLSDAKGFKAVRAEKDRLYAKIVNLFYSCYGVPPTQFDFEYVDKDGVYHLEKDFTPKSFFDKYVGAEVDEFVSVINAPTEDKPFGKSFTIDYLGNVVGGKPVTHLNVKMDRMIKLILSQLKDDQIVWFGSDVSYYGDREAGAWDDKAFDYETAFELDFDADKAEALDYGISAMNHAMCIVGVNLVKGKPTKWKIENSWGTDVAKKGFYIMSDSWFKKYTYQAVVNKKYLTEEELAAYNAEPIHLKPWDPMGSLAD